MQLPITEKLLEKGINKNEPVENLIEILHSSIELLSIPNNDFCWSSWEDSTQAINEIEELIVTIQNGYLPERLDVSVLFSATGPIQEVSVSSGWAETFLRVAKKFDEVEKMLWDKKILGISTLLLQRLYWRLKGNVIRFTNFHNH